MSAPSNVEDDSVTEDEDEDVLPSSASEDDSSSDEEIRFSGNEDSATEVGDHSVSLWLIRLDASAYAMHHHINL